MGAPERLRRAVVRGDDRQLRGSCASERPRRQRGARSQAIGRSRGGSTTKIHTLSNHEGRPIAFHLTGGNISDFTGAAALLPQIPPNIIVHGDKGYDSDAIRRAVEARGGMPNIPPKKNRKRKNCFSPMLYKTRNAIERMFGRLKDFRRIATRYDRKAQNFLAAIHIAATVSYWL
ncbi:MAG: IS5 family transposase [Rhodobacteraceae bacterium]|nr:IS5 family transposase [Paracoccaceae bacterium]